MLPRPRRAPGLAAAALALLAAACGGDGDGGTGPGASSSLEVRASDGSAIPLSADVAIWCGAWESDVPVDAVHVLLGVVPLPGGSGVTAFYLQVVRDDAGPGTPLAFPNTFVWDQPAGARLFGLVNGIEYSSAEEDAGGSVTVQLLDCDGTVRVDFDAVLATELAGAGEPITVTGTVEGPTGPAPPHGF